MINKQYPQNLLHRLLSTYDPDMNRLDNFTKIRQRKINCQRIDDYYSHHMQIINPILQLMLNALPEREQNVIIGRYQQFLTLRQLGQMSDVTGERIRQLETRSLMLLSTPENLAILFDLIWPENAPKSVSPKILQPIQPYQWLNLFVQILKHRDQPITVTSIKDLGEQYHAGQIMSWITNGHEITESHVQLLLKQQKKEV